MNGDDWTLGLQAAKVLSLLCSDAAQRNLADAAITRKSPEQKIELLNLLGESIRANSSKLTAAQVNELQKQVIDESDSAIRQATAKVVGAMNLPPAVAKKVIQARESFGSVK